MGTHTHTHTHAHMHTHTHTHTHTRTHTPHTTHHTPHTTHHTPHTTHHTPHTDLNSSIRWYDGFASRARASARAASIASTDNGASVCASRLVEASVGRAG